MASACVNNIGMSSENFLDCPQVKYSSYGWLSPKVSFSRDYPDAEASKAAAAKPYAKKKVESNNVVTEKVEDSDLDPEICAKDFVDFEFQLEDPVTMLPADQLFSDGKLVPLHISTMRKSITTAPPSTDLRMPDIPQLHRRNEISPTDPYLFSPKAPTCSIRWKELLRLKKLYQNSNGKQEDNKTASSLSNNSNRSTTRSLKYFLHRGSKSTVNSSIDSSINLPLLKDPDTESAFISSRLSLSSSSSSGHDHDDLPRLSLDSDKTCSTIPRNTHQTASNLSKVRIAKHRSALSSEKTRVDRSPIRRTPEPPATPLGISMDSPRMNASGKIVFQSLERSSSSPSTFNGGPRYKHRGMERSYSANVRVTPVLNVPVCSIRGSSKSGVFGLPLFSSSQPNGGNRTHHHQSKNRTDRT